jgi:hypothetical protein
MQLDIGALLVDKSFEAVRHTKFTLEMLAR